MRSLAMLLLLVVAATGCRSTSANRVETDSVLGASEAPEYEGYLLVGCTTNVGECQNSCAMRIVKAMEGESAYCKDRRMPDGRPAPYECHCAMDEDDGIDGSKKPEY